MKAGVVKVITNSKSCQGCRACESICSLYHFNKINPKSTGIKIKELDEYGKFIQTVCQQCIDMPCAKVCEKNAISRNSYSGAVVIGDNCVGCGECAKACPINAIEIIQIDGDFKAFKCDLCGGVPQCVSICPRQALGW